eukprot:m.250445 g.250445  ORF g.250445 m.250445 type:complete len:63 (-) comp17176_c0_seq3:2702-2890(-)
MFVVSAYVSFYHVVFIRCLISMSLYTQHTHTYTQNTHKYTCTSDVAVFVLAVGVCSHMHCAC